MFQLSDATRRLVTLALFVSLCVAPVLVVSCVGLWRRLPGRNQREQRRLTCLLGQPVRLAAVHHLSPSVSSYEGLEIRDPESGAMLLRFDRLRVAHMPGTREKNGKMGPPRTALTAGTIHLDTESARSLWPLAERLLRRSIGDATAHLELTADVLSAESPASVHAMRQVRGRAMLQSETSHLELAFQLDGNETPKPACFRVVRNRQINPPVDGFDVYTGEGPLPCSLFAAVLPPFRGLGSECRFQGYFVANHTPEGWEGEVLGSLHDLDLEQFVARRFPHEISGAATLDLERVRFRAGRALSAQGSLRASSGRIGRSLINSLRSQLQLDGDFAGSSSGSFVPFEELALRFHLDAAGIHLWGECPSGPAGTILLYGYDQRLIQPEIRRGPYPLPAAVSALTSTSWEELALSPRSAWLVQRLPLALPAAASPSGEIPVAGR